MREHTVPGSSSIDDTQPTQELYIKLRNLEAEAEALNITNEPSPAVADDDPTGLNARIARLKALLTDRGASN